MVHSYLICSNPLENVLCHVNSRHYVHFTCHRIILLGEHGITTPRTRIKWAEGCALQGVCSRDLTGTDLAGACTQNMKGVRTGVLAGTHGARAGNTVGARTRIRAHERDKGTSVAIVRSKIPVLVHMKGIFVL